MIVSAPGEDPGQVPAEELGSSNLTTTLLLVI